MKSLIEKEIDLHQFETRTNRDKVQKLLHPNFREIGVTGLNFNLSTILKLLEQEINDGNSIHSQDYECVKLSDDLYQLFYKSVSINSYGKPESYAKRTSIWKHSETSWRMIYHQGTKCAPFKIPSDKVCEYAPATIESTIG